VGGGGWGCLGGGSGPGVEITQALYAHMNNKKIKVKKKERNLCWQITIKKEKKEIVIVSANFKEG
jgi:hypothetical protein